MKKILSTILFVLFAIFLSPAQVDRSKAPLPGPPPKIVVGDYESFTLSNGLRVVVVENHKIPRVTYSMVLDYDPVMQGEKEGYVDFAGSLMGTGTVNRSKDQFNQEVDFLGASLNFFAGGMNARCLKKHNEKLLELMSDALLNPAFTAEELEKIRLKTLSELQAAKTEPDAIAERVSSSLFFGKDHPYGHSMTEASVAAITLDECKEFYRNFFRPNIAYLAVVGDISASEIRPLLEKYLGPWQSAPVPMATYETPQKPAKPVVALVDRPVSVQSLIRIGYPVDLKIGDEDLIKAKVANTILGGGTFRLFNNLREKHGYTYGAYSRLSQDKYIGNFMATAEVRNSVTDSAITQILYEMKRMTEEKVPEEELSMVKNYAGGTFALSLENPQTIAGFALNIERFGLPKDYYETYLEKLAAVTSDDILRVAKKYFRPDQAYIFVVGKGEEVAGKLTRFDGGQKINYYDIDGNAYDPAKKTKAAPAGITAAQVIEKYVDAIGGRKKLSRIKDMTTSMSMSMQGMSISITTYQKSPDKILVEVGTSGMVMSKQVYDGKKAFVTSPMGNEELSGEQLDAMKYQAILFLEASYEKYGIQAELAGIEEVNGKEAYRIELSYPGGRKETDFYDTGSGLVVKKISSEGEQTLEDYRAVKGILVPFRLTQEMGGQQVKIFVNEVKFNTKIKDDLFKAE